MLIDGRKSGRPIAAYYSNRETGQGVRRFDWIVVSGLDES